MSLLFILSLLEYRIIKPAVRRNAKPRAKNNYFLHSLMELMIIFDIITIVMIALMYFNQLNANYIAIFMLIVLLSSSISIRASWLRENTVESYKLEREEEKSAREQLFPSVAQTIARSSDPNSLSIPHERNPALDLTEPSDSKKKKKKN